MDPDLARKDKYFLLFDDVDLFLVIVGDDVYPILGIGNSFKLIRRRKTSMFESYTNYYEK